MNIINFAQVKNTGRHYNNYKYSQTKEKLQTYHSFYFNVKAKKTKRLTKQKDKIMIKIR